MNRINHQARQLLRFAARHQQRNFSSPAAAAPPKRAAVAAPRGGGGGGSFLFSALFLISGAGLVAYKLEEGDPKVTNFLTNNIPQLIPILDPLRSVIRSSGIVSSSTPPPAAAAPIKEASPITVQTTKTVEKESSPVKEATVSKQAEVKVEEKKNEPVAVVAVKAATATSTAPVEAAVAVASPDQLTAAEVKARQLRLSAASELFDELSMQAVALRRELEQSLLKDLHKLDADALRTRMTQLAAEFFERTKWESLRLHQSLRQVETDVARKYLELMNQQRIELETEMKRVVSTKEEQIAAHHAHLNSIAQTRADEQLSSALHAQAENLREAFSAHFTQTAEGIRSDLQDEMNHQIAILREAHVKELLDVQRKVSALESELTAFSVAADTTDNTSRSATRQHQNSSAVLALEGALSSSKPFAVELAAVRAAAAAADDALALAVAESIPASASATGVPTLPELRARFAVVRREVRKAALAPDQAPTIIGQLIGSTLAMVAPAPRGFVAGGGVDETMARAAYYLERGNLSAAVKEVEGVTGYPRVLTNDWNSMAASRLVADQAAAALRTSALLQHAAYGKTTSQ